MKLNQKGFSLLEILIALAIFVVMAVMMSQALYRILLSKDNIEESAEFYRTVTVGLQKIYDDLNMAFLANRSFFGQDQYYATGFVGDKESLNFSTSSHIHFVTDLKDTDQVIVGYSLKKNEEGSTDLVRRETLHLVDNLEKGGKSFILIPKIKSLELEYYNLSKKDWDTKWDTNTISYANQLPNRVRVKLEVYGLLQDEAGEDRETHFFEFIAPVPMHNRMIDF